MKSFRLADKITMELRRGPNSPAQYGWRVLLICPDAELTDTVMSTLAAVGLKNVLQVSEAPEPYEITSLTAGIQICLIEVSSARSRSLVLLERIASAGVSVIALHTQPDLDLQLECLRRGVSEFVTFPVETAQLQHTLDRIAARRQYGSRLSRQPGAIYAVMAGKGGSGSTTVAAHLALALSKERSRRILLVDIDGITGSVSLVLKLKPAFSLLDCAADLDRLDDELWSSLLMHVGPLGVLAAPARPTRIEMPIGELPRLLDFWRASYDAVILDLPSSPIEFSLECARQADMLLLIATCDLASLYSTARQSTYLESCGIRPGAFKVVLNRFRPSFVSNVCNGVVGRPVFAHISEAGPALEKALLDGEPLPGSSRFAADIGSLARQITGWPSEESRDRYRSIQRSKTLVSQLYRSVRAKLSPGNPAKALQENTQSKIVA